MNKEVLFSDKLEHWLRSKKTKTIADLLEVFDEKSFAVCLLILMFLPALPLPTGGVTHVFEIISTLLGFEMLFGKKTIWLPKKWQKIDISQVSKGKAIPVIIKRLKWVEERSKPRLAQVVSSKLFLIIAGLFVIIFSLAAFFAPPFSGLDTLPSIGVIMIALAIIFEDIILYILGIVAGIVGIGLILTIGGVLLNSLKLWF